MSTESSSCSENSYDSEELFQIRNRWKELRKEKDLWRDSQSDSFELIRKLELHSRTLSEAQTKDKKRIEQLEKELSNCSQEKDYLQDQLNARNIEVNYLEEQVSKLQLKTARVGYQEEEVIKLLEELKVSNSDHSILLQELESKDLELQEAATCIDKLEESISSSGLEYQCEIESLKLDLLALQQELVNSRKSQKNTALKNAEMIDLAQDLEIQIQEDEEIIEYLENDNRDLRERLQKLETGIQSRGETDATSQQIHEYELFVNQLKKELKEEKFKAKEEAEDLTQEMAELRYQITGLLEDEHKRRACVEQISLQRIAELEAELEKERSKSLNDEDREKTITLVRNNRSFETSSEKR